MEITVTMDGGASGEEIRSLRDWLVEGDPRFRGRVRLQAGPPVPGTLGPVLDALEVILGPGGAASALVALAVSWVRHRSSDVKLRLTLPDGRSVEVSAKRLRGLDAAQLTALVTSYAEALEAPAGEAAQ